MALRARKVSAAFEKRAPGVDLPQVDLCLILYPSNDVPTGQGIIIGNKDF